MTGFPPVPFELGSVLFVTELELLTQLIHVDKSYEEDGGHVWSTAYFTKPTHRLSRALFKPVKSFNYQPYSASWWDAKVIQCKYTQYLNQSLLFFDEVYLGASKIMFFDGENKEYFVEKSLVFNDYLTNPPGLTNAYTFSNVFNGKRGPGLTYKAISKKDRSSAVIRAMDSIKIIMESPYYLRMIDWVSENKF